MSNSPADRASRRALLARIAATGLLGAVALAPAAAERPLPALADAAPRALTTQIAPTRTPQRVRIVAVRTVGDDAAGARLRSLLSFRAADRDGASGVVLRVEVAEPFRNLTRDASPAIIVDGQPLRSHVPRGDPRTIYALLPARALSQGAGTVQVGWIGDLERTISPPAELSPR